MSKKGKIWGTTELILHTPLIEVHRLHVLPDRRCSLHAHSFKWNLFFIVRGHLTIAIVQKDYDLTDETVIGPGELTTVRPGLVHRFMSGSEPVDAIEIYYPQWLDGEDIIRQDVGGIVRKKTRGRV